MCAAPYLSVVVTARNDDHGGNLLGRMQVFVDAWISQAKRHNLSSELIVVEWNPPAGRPLAGQDARFDVGDDAPMQRAAAVGATGWSGAHCASRRIAAA